MNTIENAHKQPMCLCAFSMPLYKLLSQYFVNDNIYVSDINLTIPIDICVCLTISAENNIDYNIYVSYVNFTIQIHISLIVKTLEDSFNNYIMGRHYLRYFSPPYEFITILIRTLNIINLNT